MKFTLTTILFGLIFLVLIFNSCVKGELQKDNYILRNQLISLQKSNDSLNSLLNKRADSLSKVLVSSQKRADSLSNILRTKSDSLSQAIGLTNAILANMAKSVDSIKSQNTIINDQLTQLNSQLTSITIQLTQLNQQLIVSGGDLSKLDVQYQSISVSLQIINTQISVLVSEHLKLLEKLNTILLQLNPSVVISTGLIAYYPFNGNANDSSGNNNDGIKNQVIASTDRKGNPNSCYLFNKDSSYIRIEKLSNIDLGDNEFTISMWINVESLDLNSGCKFFNKGTNSIVISLFDNGTSGLPNSGLKYGLGWDSYGKNYGIYPDIIDKSGWHFIVCVKTNSGYDYYINNKKYSLPFNDMNISKSDLSFSLFLGNTPNSRSNFNGYLDEIRIYNRALTQQEITNLSTN
jgi:hypothetical protein